MKESGGYSGLRCKGVVGNRERGEKEFVERMSGMATIIIDEAKNVAGSRVEKEVGND